MAVKAILSEDEFNELPEPIQEHYIQDDGSESYRLDVTSVDGFQLADIGKLQSALQKERGTKSELEKKLKAFADIDAEEARAALELKKKFDEGDLTDEQAERLKQKEKELADKFESQRKAIEQKYGEQIEGLQNETKSLRGDLHSARVVSEAKSAISKHKGSEKLLLPLIERVADLVEENGKREVRIKSSDGTHLLSRRSNSTSEYMGIEEYVAALKEDDDFARAFEGSGASGSGTPNANSSSGGGSAIRISPEDARDPQKYRAAKTRAEKDGKQLVIG